MSYYDPVNQTVFNKVMNIDKNYVNHNKYIFNQIDSYLRCAPKAKVIPHMLLKIGNVRNDMNEPFYDQTIKNTFNINKKFLNYDEGLVDMSDYKKPFEPQQEKQMGAEIIKKQEQQRDTNIKREADQYQENEKTVNSELSQIGMGKKLPIPIIGNQTLPSFNFIGLDIGNEFKANMPKKLRKPRQPRKPRMTKKMTGGAMTAFPDMLTEEKIQQNKKIVENVKNLVNSNILDEMENSDLLQKEKSMKGAEINVKTLNRKIGGAKKAISGGRAEYQKKLKEIRMKHNCSLKDAMKIYSQNKNK